MQTYLQYLHFPAIQWLIFRSLARQLNFVDSGYLSCHELSHSNVFLCISSAFSKEHSFKIFTFSSQKSPFVGFMKYLTVVSSGSHLILSCLIQSNILLIFLECNTVHYKIFLQSICCLL